MTVLLFKESLQRFDVGTGPQTLDPVWILDGQYGDEEVAKEHAKVLAKAAPAGHSTGRYAILELKDPPGQIFKASVPDEPTVSLRKVSK